MFPSFSQHSSCFPTNDNYVPPFKPLYRMSPIERKGFVNVLSELFEHSFIVRPHLSLRVPHPLCKEKGG